MISPRGVEVSPALSIVESVVDIQSAVFWVICKQSSATYDTPPPPEIPQTASPISCPAPDLEPVVAGLKAVISNTEMSLNAGKAEGRGGEPRHEAGGS